MHCLIEPQIQQVIRNLCNPTRPANAQDIDYSIYATAMRTVIANATPSVTNARLITEELLPVLRGSVQGSVDNMDVLISLIMRFGSSFTAQEIANTEKTLLSVLQQETGLVQKRSIAALGIISPYLESKQYVDLIQYILSEFNANKSNYQSTKNLSLLCGTVAKADPSKFKCFLPELLPVIVESLKTSVIGEEEDESSDLLETRDASLGTLEVFSDFDSNTVEPFIKDILDVCKPFLAYDPNFFDEDEVDIFDPDGDVSMNENAAEEDEEDEEDDGFEDDEYDIDENAFSDDEDQSWKMRRHAAVLASNLLKTCPGSLPMLYDDLLKLLILRITKEREETVKIACFDALSLLVSAAGKDKYYYSTKVNYAHKRKTSDTSMFINADPADALAEVLPVIVKYTVNDLNNKSVSVNIKHSAINLLTNLVTVSEVIPVDELTKIVATTSELAQVPATPYLSDLLKLVSAILTSQSASALKSHLSALSLVIITGISDSYYRTALEGLEAAHNLFPLYKENAEISGKDLMDTFISKFSITAFDIETRKQAMHALGGLVAVGRLTQSEVDKSAAAICEQLDNELLRIDALQAIALFASSQDVADSLSSEWIYKTSQSVSVFLKQKSLPLRSDALNVLHALLKITAERSVAQNVADDGLGTICQELLNHAQRLTEPSVAEVPLVGTIVSIFADVLDALALGNSPVLGGITDFAKSVVSQDFAVSLQKQLLALFDKITRLPGGSEIYDDVASLLLKGHALIPAVVAICIVNGQMFDKVEGFVATVNESSESPVAIEKSLQVLGNVGKRSSVTIPLDGIYANFDNSNDKVRVAAAVALGNVIIGNLSRYLPDLLPRLTNSKGKNGYLYLVALRDVVLYLQKNPSAADSQTIDEIWDCLFSLRFNDDMSEEGEKALVAECIGRLSIIDPEKFLPALKEKLSSPEVSVRRSVVSGVKYTFGLSHEKYDRLLRPIIVDFLVLMEDQNMSIRQVALGALTSAIHNKPHLLLPHLSRLLPLLYRETVINEALIRTVQMGPFKHKVDDGLDLRKAAYESMFTLATTLPREWQLNLFKDDEFIERVLVGLDDDHDIRVLSCVTIARIVTVDVRVLSSKRPSSTVSNLEELIEKFRKILETVVKDTALKQEVENQSELERNVVRASNQINEAIEAAANQDGQHATLSDMEMKQWSSYMSSQGMRKNQK